MKQFSLRLMFLGLCAQGFFALTAAAAYQEELAARVAQGGGLRPAGERQLAPLAEQGPSLHQQLMSELAQRAQQPSGGLRSALSGDGAPSIPAAPIKRVSFAPAPAGPSSSTQTSAAPVQSTSIKRTPPAPLARVDKDQLKVYMAKVQRSVDERKNILNNPGLLQEIQAFANQGDEYAKSILGYLSRLK